MLRRGLLCALVGGWTLCSAALAEDVFFRVRLSEMKFADGELPNYRAVPRDGKVRQRVMQTPADVQLDEAGEAYLQRGDVRSSVFAWSEPVGQAPVHLVIRAAAKRDVSGRLVLPKPDGSGLVAVKFRIPADTAQASAAREFQFAKIEHYERRLMASNIGAAWYRHQIETAHKALGELSQVAPQRGNGNRNNELDRTYDLFSGGRAVSENLQLDRSCCSLAETRSWRSRARRLDHRDHGQGDRLAAAHQGCKTDARRAGESFRPINMSCSFRRSRRR